VRAERGVFEQFVAHGLGRHAGERQGRFKGGIDLGLRFDQAANRGGDGRRDVFGFFAAAFLEPFHAADSGPLFVQSGLDGIA
jgi:hypothetical protein